MLKGEDYRWGGQVNIRVIAEVGIWLEWLVTADELEWDLGSRAGWDRMRIRH